MNKTVVQIFVHFFILSLTELNKRLDWIYEILATGKTNLYEDLPQSEILSYHYYILEFVK